MSQTIDIPSEQVPQEQTQALQIRETGGAVGRALTFEQITERLAFIKQVMKEVMIEGQDYGKIPGTGDKPSLLQPGAQKLLMTFNLREQIKKEVLRDFPNYHREYEMTVTVFPAGQRPDDGWDGVGTCSTLESKYRYRRAERKCPACGHTTILPENPKFLKPGQVAGFFCWKKKGGCGATFAAQDARIIGQPGGDVENEDPADVWNTVRKMAFKRALVAAAINATNTSELWTQDLEDMEANRKAKSAQDASGGFESASPAQRGTPLAQSAGNKAPEAAPSPKIETPKPKKVASEKTREWMMLQLEEEFGGESWPLITEFFQKAGCLLPSETLDDLPLRWVPVSRDQMQLLVNAIMGFGEGEEALYPFPPNYEDPPAKGKAKAAPPQETKPEPPPTSTKDPEWWRKVIVPIPHKGEKRDEYMKHPDTIGSLFDLRHEQTADGQDARQRLWGFVTNFEPKGWVKRNGDQMPPSDADKNFRLALDAFAEYFEKNHPGEKL